MPNGFGQTIFEFVTAIPGAHSWLSKKVISSFADSGPLPGLYTTKQRGKTSLRELLAKEYFALEVPTPSDDFIKDLPDIDQVGALFEREGPAKESRVSALLPFFAQHLTDAVFQSTGDFETDAPHEIILNQIYGNTAGDEQLLRSGAEGKLKTKTWQVNGGEADFPDQLCEEIDGAWTIKTDYQKLSYLQKPGKPEELLKRYAGREKYLCATGLFQGNMTLGNFAITTLLVREHNRLCDGIIAERRRKNQSVSDDVIFKIAQQNNITAYMKVVIEDYINAFAGQKLFKLDTTSFFHERKRWCRETPLPYHFNILYRIHAMIPDHLKGFEDQGYKVMLANNDLVMEHGIGAIFQTASSQGAGQATLGNTHPNLLGADKAGVRQARKKLGSFYSHRAVQNPSTAISFDDFDPDFRETLKKLYEKPERVDYAVGILAELPQPGWLEKLGIKDEPIIGATLMNAIAKHAFRHILSNRYMTKEYLNPDVMSDFGWQNLHSTASVADLVKRNVAGEMDQDAANNLRISFENPDYYAW